MAGAVAAVPAVAALSPEERAGITRAFMEDALPRLTGYIDGEALNVPLQTDIAVARR